MATKSKSYKAAAEKIRSRSVGLPEFEIVERVLVAFKREILEAVRDPLVRVFRLSVLPVRRIHNLLDARLQHRLEMLAHLHKHVFALCIDPLFPVLPVQCNHCMARRAGSGEEVEDASRRWCDL